MEFNPSEGLRQVMRQWSSGVAVVSAFADGKTYGMTVNSLVSISMEPPIVAVTLANSTKTQELPATYTNPRLSVAIPKGSRKTSFSYDHSNWPLWE